MGSGKADFEQVAGGFIGSEARVPGRSIRIKVTIHRIVALGAYSKIKSSKVPS